jgi:hypothetical protein
VFYLVAFENAISRTLDEFASLILWGGGYGNLARLLRLRNPHATILIVDSPISAALQWLYLSSVIGEEAVRIVTDRQAPLEEGFFSITTPDCALEFAAVADVFIALWSLGDDEAARLLLDKDFFAATHFLIGLTDGSSSTGTRVRQRARFIGDVSDAAPRVLAFR